MGQLISNLPNPLLDIPAFFAVKPNKVPIVKDWGNPKNQNYYNKIEGLMGFDITKAGILVFDFDHVLNKDGSFCNEKAKNTFERIMQLNPYTEVSISLGGIHIAVKPTKGKFDKITNAGANILYFDDNHKAKDCPKLEIFYGSKARYVLFTGNVFRCKPNTPIPEGELVDLLVQKILDEIHQSKVNKNPADTLPAMHMKQDNNSNNNNNDYNFTLEEIKEALKHIPADLPYNDWLNILMAAHSFDSGVAMMNIMDDWSRTAPSKYKEGLVDYNWKGFNSSDGITIATLFKYAKDYGFDHRAFYREYHKNNNTPPKSKDKFSDEVVEKFILDKVNNNTSVIDNIKDNLQTNSKGDRALSNTYNFKLILQNDPLIKDSIGYDLFNEMPTRLKKFSWTSNNLKKDNWRDVDDAGVQNYIDLTYGIRNVSIFNTTFLEFTYKNSFHPVREYLNNLPEWDKVERSETFFINALGVEDSTYSRTVSFKWLLASVVRIMHPASKFDYCLVFKGNQGIGKSTVAKKLGVNWFNDSISNIDNKDGVEGLLGSWIIELGEMQATRKADNEAIKAFISRTEDIIRLPYKKRKESFPRQCVFCATTNNEEFLKDRTGARRFWILICNATIDTTGQRLDKLDRNYIDQLWAEVLFKYKQICPDVEVGEKLYDTQFLDIPADVRKVAIELQTKHTEGSELTGMVEHFCDMLVPYIPYWYRLSLNARILRRLRIHQQR